MGILSMMASLAGLAGLVLGIVALVVALQTRDEVRRSAGSRGTPTQGFAPYSREQVAGATLAAPPAVSPNVSVPPVSEPVANGQMPPQVSSTSFQASPEVLALVQRGEHIEAIKLVREQTGLGLAEAKHVVDGLRHLPGMH